MAFLTAAGEYLGGLVHPSAMRHEKTAAHHCAFIASHLVGGIAALAIMPLFLLLRGNQPSTIEIVALTWLIAPIVAALYLSRTGRLDRAHTISTASVAALIALVAGATGGVQSVALVWLPIVAFEAACQNSRRGAFGVAACSIALVGGLSALGAAGVLPTAVPLPALLTFVIAVGAILYACAVAVRRDAAQDSLDQASLDSDARYAFLADHTTDLVTQHTRNGLVVFASPAAQRLLGVRADELMGRGLFERVHIADRPAFLTALSSITLSGPLQFRLRRSSMQASSPPHFIWVEMRCQAIVSQGLKEARARDHVVVVIRDISEQKAREDHLEAARADADRADAAKGHFLASMSHELRTPLNAIIGFSELLAGEGKVNLDEVRRHEYARLIHDSGLHLLAVVNGILDMSRLDSGNFSIEREPFSLKPVIDSCVQLFALKAASASVRVDADVSDALPQLLADRRACKQILINLLSNAIKFTPVGGRIHISAQQDRGHIRIEVADTGVGVSAHDLPRLGTSFFQVRSAYDRPYEGTGLGLCVVKGLVALHGGTFEVRSRLGEGTRVIVILPLIPEEISTSEQTQVPIYLSERRAAHG